MRLFRLSVVALVLAIVLFVPSELVASADTEYSAYDSLTDQQKTAYDSLYSTVSEMGSECDISFLTAEESEIMRGAFLSDHPELFWFENEYSLFVYKATGMASSITHTGDLTLSEAEAMSKELKDAAAALTIGGSTPADVIRSIHDAVAYSTHYDKTADQCNNAYGALVEGRSKCDGYASAFNYLCHQNSISSLMIVGSTESESDSLHAWNLVHMNSTWYYVDVTWDDVACPDCAGYDYFLIGSETDTPTGKFSSARVADTEFGVSASTTSYGYDPYSGDTYTRASSLKYSVIQSAGGTVTNYYLPIGDYKLTYNSLTMKTLAKYMENGSYDNWAVSVKRSPASQTYGLSGAFDCDVRMYLDEEPITLKELGLEGKFALEVPTTSEYLDYFVDAYRNGEKISHGGPFNLKETGTYTVGYIEKTFLEKWGLVLGGVAVIAAFLVFKFISSRRYPPNYVPDYDGIGTERRFDRDSICPECGHILETNAEFCPYCGRKV